ncbi:hypothetical protein HDU67_010426 [Dinochytrium kinnereticum]|nr:hypothetical protein HDU67_010426 [Dinochytrium kinnereticum]
MNPTSADTNYKTTVDMYLKNIAASGSFGTDSTQSYAVSIPTSYQMSAGMTPTHAIESGHVTTEAQGDPDVYGENCDENLFQERLELWRNERRVHVISGDWCDNASWKHKRQVGVQRGLAEDVVEPWNANPNTHHHNS